MNPILELAQKRPVLFDGAMGTEIDVRNPSQSDYGDYPQVNEVLVLTKPEIIQDIHEAYIKAGSDVIETNTFGANRLVLAEYGLENMVKQINTAAVEVALKAAAKADRPVWVSGSMGPGSKLPSLGQVDFDTLFDVYFEQADALIKAGVTSIQIETSQDPLQMKAACMASVEAAKGKDILIICQGTFDANARMLLGTEPGAFVTTITAIDGIGAIGINCSVGPDQMYEVLRTLTRLSPLPVLVMPNAGLPKTKDGRQYYDLSPQEYVRHMIRFVEDFGVEFVGGCCGTTPEHIRALKEALEHAHPKKRQAKPDFAASSLYIKIPYKQQPRPLIIGERTNTSGSKAFRSALLSDDWEGVLEIAKDQEAEGAHVLDVSVAWAGRDEVHDMAKTVEVLRGAITIPLMLDSTNPNAIETGLKRYPGKVIINSVNLEDQDKLHEIAELARRYGAALVALAIDEKDMARDAQTKVDVLLRILKILEEEHKINPGDVFLDTLTFTVASGDHNLRDAAIHTLEAIKKLKEVVPVAPTVLGVSNISYGLKAKARKVLNSVFLHHALEAGLDAAILNAGRIIHPSEIPQEVRKAADDLLFNRGEEALTHYMSLFEKGQKSVFVKKVYTEPKDELYQRVVKGNKKGIEDVVNKVLEDMDPQEVVNKILIAAMGEVGELFGRGELQLPFVLRSAQTMKAAMAVLEPLLRKQDVPTKGTVILATVKGDVHDIGKNLVAIILENSGWKVVDLGTGQAMDSIIKAAHEHNAIAIGLSGLLLKSALFMKEGLQELKRRGEDIPVLVGGAALSKRFVQEELATVYDGPVYYCKDAFDAAKALDAIMDGRPWDLATMPREKRVKKIRKKQVELKRPEPMKPQFTEIRAFSDIDLSEVIPCIDREALFKRRWKFHYNAEEEFEQAKKEQLMPLFNRLITEHSNILKPKGILGFFRACSQGTNIIIGNDKSLLIHSVEYPKGIAWLMPECGEGVEDWIGLGVVTVGPDVDRVKKELFDKGEFEEYHYLHGLAAEVAEATMNYIHHEAAKAWGFGGARCHWAQGGRMSVGYPSIPDLEDQKIILKLLDAEKIGVFLTKSLQLTPEASITALILHDMP